jgi:serine/threonine protein phosphatase PrpC
MTSRVPAVEIAVRTDPGRDPDKQVNEDSNAFKETALGLLCVVCDGMGGHAGGREASELAIKTIVEIVESAPPVANPGQALKRAIEEANAKIWTMPTAEAGFRPGSTVVAILAHDAGAEIAHVGDSRIYLVHSGAISQVTRDHSMVQEMVDRNIIRAEDAAKHPDANKILRALGIAKDVEVDLRSVPLAYVNGDVFILCSDGLSDVVEPAEILDIAGSQPSKQASGQLVDLANARGGPDNITAMVVRMKTSATVNESVANARVAKTVPLTAVAMTPTINEAPARTVVQAPIAMPVAPAQIPPNTSGPPSRESTAPANRTGIVVLGIILAIVAVGAVIGVIVTANAHGKHKPVNVVEAGPTATATSVQDDAGPMPTEVNIVPAPALSTQPWRLPDGGLPEPCAAYRRLRDRGDASPDTLDKLDKRCRASGGIP